MLISNETFTKMRQNFSIFPTVKYIINESVLYDVLPCHLEGIKKSNYCIKTDFLLLQYIFTYKRHYSWISKHQFHSLKSRWKLQFTLVFLYCCQLLPILALWWWIVREQPQPHALHHVINAVLVIPGKWFWK